MQFLSESFVSSCSTGLRFSSWTQLKQPAVCHRQSTTSCYHPGTALSSALLDTMRHAATRPGTRDRPRAAWRGAVRRLSARLVFTAALDGGTVAYGALMVRAEPPPDRPYLGCHHTPPASAPEQIETSSDRISLVFLRRTRSMNMDCGGGCRLSRTAARPRRTSPPPPAGSTGARTLSLLFVVRCIERHGSYALPRSVITSVSPAKFLDMTLVALSCSGRYLCPLHFGCISPTLRRKTPI